MRMIQKVSLIVAILFLTSAGVEAQVSPIQGLGSIQLLDNSGRPATSGCFYFYVAGTSTQQATFTDSSGQFQNTNPLCLTTGARANGVWLTTSAQYKIVACVNNDGPFCSAGDVLWSQDNLPGGASGGGGSASCGSGCVGFFISGTASPATSGVLRMASGDSFGWRNAGGSANLLFSNDANDILAWAGGDEKYAEINCPATAPSGFDLLCADVTAHRFKIAGNGGSMNQAVASGNDISTTDAVTAWHFGASQTPLSATVPSANQFLQLVGGNIVGTTLWAYNTPSASSSASIGSTPMVTASASGNKYVFSASAIQTAAGASCSTATTIGLTLSYTDNVTGTVVTLSPEGSGLGNTNATNSLPALIAGNGGIGVGNIQWFPMTINAKASTTVSYSTSYSAGTGCSPAPAYYLMPVLQQVQ